MRGSVNTTPRVAAPFSPDSAAHVVCREGAGGISCAECRRLRRRVARDTIYEVSTTLERILALVGRGDVRVSEHGYDQLAEDGIAVRDIVDGVRGAAVVEDHPDYPKGPCVLVLQRDRTGAAVHVVWGIPRAAEGPAVLVTAYRPDPGRWSEDLLRRRA